jgi:hypothetical protein
MKPMLLIKKVKHVLWKKFMEEKTMPSLKYDEVVNLYLVDGVFEQDGLKWKVLADAAAVKICNFKTKSKTSVKLPPNLNGHIWNDGTCFISQLDSEFVMIYINLL